MDKGQMKRSGNAALKMDSTHLKEKRERGRGKKTLRKKKKKKKN